MTSVLTNRGENRDRFIVRFCIFLHHKHSHVRTHSSKTYFSVATQYFLQTGFAISLLVETRASSGLQPESSGFKMTTRSMTSATSSVKGHSD